MSELLVQLRHVLRGLRRSGLSTKAGGRNENHNGPNMKYAPQIAVTKSVI